MANNNNKVQGPPPAGPNIPAPDLRPMKELLQAPTDGVGDAIIVPPVLANQFELKIGLLNLVTDISFHGAARTWLKKEHPNSITTWNDLDSLNSAAGGNFLTINTQEALTIIENTSKVRISRNKPQDSSASGSSSQNDAITALAKQVEALVYFMNKPIHSIQEGCETCGGPYPYYKCQVTGGYTQDVYATSGTYNSGDLLTSKEKILELFNTPLNENCSAVLLKKLLEKLRDTGRFLIPCVFQELESCMALADLGARLNLMLFSVWKKLILPKLTPTHMTLELATRTVAYIAGIAEDVFVKVGKFTFPPDFVVVDYDVDPRVPLILGRPFLRTAHALVDVHGEELTPRVGDEKLVFNVEITSKYPRKHEDESIHKIDILDITCEDHFHEVINVQKSINSMSGSPTHSSDPVVASLSPSLTPFGDSDFILEEIDTFLASDDSISPDIDDKIFNLEGDIRLIEELC
ncbi:reverse transcriptase domain-containing protein [Tanacetum coccineum]